MKVEIISFPNDNKARVVRIPRDSDGAAIAAALSLPSPRGILLVSGGASRRFRDVGVMDASVFVADARPSEPHRTEAHAFMVRATSKGWPIYLPTSPIARALLSRNKGARLPLL